MPNNKRGSDRRRAVAVEKRSEASTQIILNMNSESHDESVGRFTATNSVKDPTWKGFLKYSLISFVVLFLGAITGPFTTAGTGDSLAGYTISGAFSKSLVVFFVSSVISLAIGISVSCVASGVFKKSFSGWMLGGYAAAMISITALVFVADVTGINAHGRDKNKANLMIIDESGLWISMNLFRINLILPETPKVSKVSAPMQVRETIKGGYYDQAMIKKDGYEIIVMRIERKAKVVDLEEIRTGSINDLKNIGEVTNFRASTGEMKITGRNALWFEVFYTISGKDWSSRSLIFSEDGTLWMVMVSGDPARTVALWAKVRDSVSIGSL